MSSFFDAFFTTIIKAESFSDDAVKLLQHAENYAKKDGVKIEIRHLVTALLCCDTLETRALSKAVDLAKTLRDSMEAVKAALIFKDEAFKSAGFTIQQEQKGNGQAEKKGEVA